MPRGAAAAGGTPGLRFMPPGAMLMRRASASVGASEGRPVCTRKARTASNVAQGAPTAWRLSFRPRRLLPAACTTSALPRNCKPHCSSHPALLPSARPHQRRHAAAPLHGADVALGAALGRGLALVHLGRKPQRAQALLRAGRSGQAAAPSAGLPAPPARLFKCKLPGRRRPPPAKALGFASPRLARARSTPEALPPSQPRHLHRLWLGVDVDKHERLAAAAQARLQQVRQLGVAVRDVPALGGQRLWRGGAGAEGRQQGAVRGRACCSVNRLPFV